ncbi:putative ABC transport system ATP-binding protein [Paenibacillus sp. V4I3]|uniref:ABC transporter ATP-binding protein n=1 Tax=unclassified Paenibacillus TaxID=185978 RepID=UPI002786FEFA|nr:MULTISPECIES: ABC transporter ATP-binding protein [unclassified Paenibacillus]MDQ0874089.1 putative ABC transport system ATP-binding protein [Paenibacillus sp. V4I3]MDQ0890034.1 putative ABC transport system ATP-binding protein [Paenibacillus sp. V4I9]
MLAIERLSHSFRTGQEETPVLHELNFRVEQGEMVALLGSSGSGKSTLLNLMKPTRGSILIAGQAIEKMSENRLAEFRRTHIGFIFQSYELIPHLTVRENVELPLVFQSVASQERKQRAIALLQQVGIGDKSDMFPSQLSGGQQQRVSIDRSLITKPAIVFADEPTGNLDTKTEKEIIDLLIDLNQNGITFVIVTHEHEVARRTQRILLLRDGYLLEGNDQEGEAG